MPSVLPRRRFLPGLPLIGILPMLLLATACSEPDGPAPARPAGPAPIEGGLARGHDLLVITVDTLRADHLGCYGRAEARTPNIDSLATAGQRFEQAVTPVPITLPAHASLFTGLVPPRHGVRHNGTFRLAEEHRTLAEELREAGYATAAVVGAFVLDGRYGLSQGFEFYDDRVDRGGTAVGGARYSERPADRVTDVALRWLGEHLDRGESRPPFFLWTHYFDPHAPYAPPEPYASSFRGNPYDGEIAYTDEQLGRILDLLRERGALDRTLVVFTSDHGEGLGEHGEMTHADLIYDSTVRVPLILSHPALPPGVRADRIAGLVDVLPTVLSLLGISGAGEKGSGIDLLAADVDPDRAVYIETLSPYLDYGWAALHGLRRLGDKFIQAPEPEYFDLVRDPGETENRYPRGTAEAERLEMRLRDTLAAWPSVSDVAEQERPLDDEQRRRLASLGYVRGGSTTAVRGVKDPKHMMHVWRRIDVAGQRSVQGDHEIARGMIHGVLREEPGSAKAWYVAAQVHDRAGESAEAERCMQRAVELQPRSEGYVHLARYALARRDLAAFERALEAAESLDPRDGGIYLGRGFRLAAEGRLEAAKAEFRKALELDPVRSGDRARELLRMAEREGSGAR